MQAKLNLENADFARLFKFMSDYQNFIVDYPQRCAQLLTLLSPSANQHKLDVTLALAIAATGLLVPYERLKPAISYEQPMQDRKRYQKAAAQLDHLLKQPFLIALSGVASPNSWTYGELRSVSGLPDEWQELHNPAELSPTRSVQDVLNVLRNALAHGNIYTKPNRQGHIQEIVFVSGAARKNTNQQTQYKFVHVSPDDFQNFLLTWLSFLQGLDLPSEVIQKVLDD
uniref:hypothetical protein n=1 Tax=Trichocoleus desertorum TaxID=1481672 RepID=UPI0025B386C1|nr:hypothetical protein [Trichocoleus desertorum]